MAAASRRKGKTGENELARTLRAGGLAVEQLQRNRDATLDLIVNGRWYFDAKRQERLQLPLWLRDTAENTPPNGVPVVAFRQNAGSWFACLPLDALIDLLRASEPAV